MARKTIEVDACDYPGCTNSAAMTADCEICGSCACYEHKATIFDWRQQPVFDWCQQPVRVCWMCLEHMAKTRGATP